MGMRETFQIIIDVATENSQKSLKGLRSEVSKTEGGFNKFKVGVSGGMDFVKDHAAAFALGAGTALVGFGIKAVAAFEETAKAALDLSAATGLAVEDASRWIAVGDDFQISAETLTSSIGKIGKTLDADKWSKYGIATRNAGGQARDANDILTESLAMLSNIKNGTERARVGNELFGKGYAALSPMIGHTTDEYKNMLGTVEKGQVITKVEAERAEKMRLAQDKLSDALKDVTLAAGQAVTELAPAISDVADFVTEINNLGSKLGGSGDGGLFGKMAQFIKKGSLVYAFDEVSGIAKSAWGWISGSTDKAERDAAAADSAAKALEHLGTTSRAFAVSKAAVDDVTAAQDSWYTSTNELTAAGYAHQAQLDIVTDSINDAKIATVELDQAYRNYRDALADEQALLDTKQAFDDYTESVKKNGGESDITAEKLITLKGKLLDYAEQLGGLPPEAVTMVMAQVDQGSIDSAEEALRVLFLAAPSKSRAYSLAHPGTAPSPASPNAKNAGGPSGVGATGGIVTRPTNALIGEAGPEMVIPLSSMPGASPLPSGIGGGTSINLTVHAGLGTDGNAVGQQIVNMLKQYQRTNGPFDFTSR
jgi:hypothetical protein